MKNLKLFFKILLLFTLSFSLSFAHAVELTGAHFIKTFEQMEELGKQKSTSAEAAVIGLSARFNMAKDLPPEEFNFVIYELLNKYVKYPELRTGIQGILSSLAHDMNEELFNARQEHSTPIFVANALITGMTLVGLGRMGKTLYSIGKRKKHGQSLEKTVVPEKIAEEIVPETRQFVRMGFMERLGSGFVWAVQKCANRTACKFTMQSIFVGTMVEGYRYLFTRPVPKAHPLETLRIVQANLGCELHWKIRDYMKWWKSLTDFKEIHKQIGEFKERRKELEDSYKSLVDLYKDDLKGYRKHYPNSEAWLNLASTILEEDGRTCNEVSTDAMKLDLTSMEVEFYKKFRTEIDEHNRIINEKNTRARLERMAEQDVLSGKDWAHTSKVEAEKKRKLEEMKKQLEIIMNDMKKKDGNEDPDFNKNKEEL